MSIDEDFVNDGEYTSYIGVFLAPLGSFLAEPDVTDIYINRPGELWIERLGSPPERVTAPMLTPEALWRLARQIAQLTHQGISRAHPLLSATLPGGERIQIVAPPATRGDMAIAIRKHIVRDLELEDYAKSGALDHTDMTLLGPNRRRWLRQPEESPTEFLRRAVRERANIVISGGTATGKTTFLNTLARNIGDDERLVFIEDASEIRVRQPNAVGLIAVKGSQGEASVTAADLLQAALRMRPDRIIIGELRGEEAYAFLRAVNTGHPGSITTIHADSPAGAIDQLALIILQSGVALTRTDIVNYVSGVIDIFVQLSRVGGRFRVDAISQASQN